METRSMKKLRLRKRENEDRISDLPDPIIQHILSFLPSTKQSIQTTVLSKRWRNQWTRVPVLIFNCNIGMSLKNFLKFINNVLIRHDCSKIYKFQIHYPYGYKGRDAQFAKKIAFATRKYVEELNLYCTKESLLPEFLFDNASLVKLRTAECSFMPQGKVNWGCLSVLEIADCEFPCQALENIVSGSPSLKSLKLIRCDLEKIIIISKSLKKLLISFCEGNISVVEILCPNLKEFSLKEITTEDPNLLSQAIENVLSVSLLLVSFKLCLCSVLGRLVIASKSLKKLVLKDIGSESFDIEISCPRLEELKFIGEWDVNTVKLLDLSSSLFATIDFPRYGDQKTFESMVIQILQQLQYLKELKISTSFLEIVSTIKLGSRFSPLLNIQCLTLNAPLYLKHHSGIANILSISPMLEKLIINVPSSMVYNWNIEENYWDSNAVVFDCLVSHLKTIKIMGFPEGGGRRKHILNLVKFLLNNATVLEKIVVILKKDHIGTSPLDLSQELLSLPRCSQKAIIEVVRF